MRKFLLVAILLISLIACERNVETNLTEQKQQTYGQSHKKIDSIQSSKKTISTDLETTDPKDIIVPPRH